MVAISVAISRLLFSIGPEAFRLQFRWRSAISNRVMLLRLEIAVIQRLRNPG